MDYSSEDLQQPDESRPAKRVRLDAPLHVTEEVQEELDDGDDWNDIYGGSDDGLQPRDEETVDSSIDANNVGLGARDSLGFDHDDVASAVPKPAESESVSNGTLDLAPVGERAPEREDAIDESQTRVINGGDVPAEAIDDGDDLIDEQHHVSTVEEPAIRMVEEISAINGNENPVLDGLESAINQDDRFMQAQSQQADVRTESLEEETETNGSMPQKKATEDTEFMAAATAQKENKIAEWQFDSSDAESSSDSDSDSESDSGDSDDDSDGGYEMMDPATVAKMLMQGDGDEDDGDKGKKSNGDRQPRTANEIKETIIPKPDVSVTAEMKITELGIVERAVENMVLIKGSTPGEYQVLESGSVLCNEKREIVGAVLETLGRVQAPMYSVQFTNAQDIEDAGLNHGVKVYYVDSHSTFVFTQPLKNLKGTDASNIHDEEIGEEEMEFSDDEAEAEYKRQKKQAKKAGRGGLIAQAGRGGSRNSDALAHDSFVNASDAPRQNYGGGMSYDDEPTEDFYSPLKRPDNLGEMMAGAGPQASRPQPGNFDRGRGRGRGDRGRGRGDRGRGHGERTRGRGGLDNSRGGDRGRGRSNSDHQRGSDRGRGNGGHQTGHRGNAQSFPDRHNNEPKPAAVQHELPPKPELPQHSAPAIQQYAQPQYQQAVPSTYQFNGYTFQRGVQPPNQPHQPTYYPQQQSPAAAAPITPGSYTNPAYYQPQQASQQAHWATQPGPYPTSPMHPQTLGAYPPFNGQQAYTPGSPGTGGYGNGAPPEQQTNLADVLRRLGGQP